MSWLRSQRSAARIQKVSMDSTDDKPSVFDAASRKPHLLRVRCHRAGTVILSFRVI